MRKAINYFMIFYFLFTLNNILLGETKAPVVIERYALIVGCNYGGGDLEPLIIQLLVLDFLQE